MDPQEIKKINDSVEGLKRRISKIENANLIDRKLDNSSKGILSQIISDSIIDIVWDKYYHYHTFFEAAGSTASGTFGWIISASGATSGIDSTGVFIKTDGVSGDTGFLLKAPLYQNIVSFDQQSRFRTAVYFSSNSATDTGAVLNMRAFVGNGNGSSGGTLTTNLPYYGFYLNNNNLYGVTSNGSTGTQALVLANITYNTLYLLEARYYPGYRADFFVSNGNVLPQLPTSATRPTIRNSISTTLPSGSGTLVRFQLETREAVDKGLSIGFYEYIQERIST